MIPASVPNQEAPRDTLCDVNGRGHEGPCVQAPGHLDEHLNAKGERWFNYGPLDTYEITWMSGHIEKVQAHLVDYPHAGLAMLGSGSVGTESVSGPPRIRMQAEIDGRWVLTLQAREDDIRAIRLVTGGEQFPGGVQ